MPLQPSEIAPFPTPLDGPVLECAPVAADSTEQTLRIRARRLYPVSRNELFAAWTRRTAWESWMRMRARSRATLAPHRGGAFRLELAEGPTIHVITGTVLDKRDAEFLSLSWIHQGKGDHLSTVDVYLRDRHGMTELTLVHHDIARRREAAWLMRLWAAVLRRLATYLEDGAAPPSRQLNDRGDRGGMSYYTGGMHEGAMRFETPIPAT